jgi:hypothetical protein
MPRTSLLGNEKAKVQKLFNLHRNLIAYQCFNKAIRCLIPKDDNSDADSADSESDSESDFESDSDSPVEFGFPSGMVECIVEEHQRLESLRYLMPRTAIPKSIEWREDFALNEPDHHFRTYFRIHKSSFLALLRLIHDHPVFHNNSNNQQRPVYQQLMVALYHFGSDGAGGARDKVALPFAIGKGTVFLYTERVITAILSHISRFIRWSRPGTKAYTDTINLHLLYHGSLTIH